MYHLAGEHIPVDRLKSTTVKSNIGPRQASGPRGVARPLAQSPDELTRAQRLLLGIQRELEMARQMRAEAEKYRRQAEARTRSDMQRLILDTRLSLKKEMTRLEAEASEQLKRLLYDIRMIRLAAQEELEAQRQFTRAAKISALSSTDGKLNQSRRSSQ